MTSCFDLLRDVSLFLLYRALEVSFIGIAFTLWLDLYLLVDDVLPLDRTLPSVPLSLPSPVAVVAASLLRIALLEVLNRKIKIWWPSNDFEFFLIPFNDPLGPYEFQQFPLIAVSRPMSRRRRKRRRPRCTWLRVTPLARPWVRMLCEIQCS